MRTFQFGGSRLNLPFIQHHPFPTLLYLRRKWRADKLVSWFMNLLCYLLKRKAGIGIIFVLFRAIRHWLDSFTSSVAQPVKLSAGAQPRRQSPLKIQFFCSPDRIVDVPTHFANNRCCEARKISEYCASPLHS